MNVARLQRRGMSLIDLLVVIALIGLLIAMLLPAVVKTREAAERIKCTNNQRQLATAVHNFHSDYNRLPVGTQSLNEGKILKFGEIFNKNNPGVVAAVLYVDLLPYIEEKANYDATSETGVIKKCGVVKTFLCPSRRPADKVSAQKDYYPIDSPGYHVDKAPDWGGGAISEKDKPKVTKQVRSLFGTGDTVTLAAVTNLDGTSNTVMLAHGALKPKNYLAGVRVDDDLFYQPSGTKGANRSGFLKGPLSAGQDSDKVDETLISSPHARIHSMAFGDGSVRNIAYEALEKAPFWIMVGYNDGHNYRLDD